MSSPTIMRDPLLEAQILEQACEPLMEGGAHFRHLVRSRLAIGDDRYGNSYLEKDNLSEAAEEPADCAAWGLLHLQACGDRLSEDEFQELKMLIVGMVHASAQADIATRRAIDFMRELNE